MRKKFFLIFTSFLTFGLNISFAQYASPSTYSKGWHFEDRMTSGVYGISLNKAYNELLKNMQPQKKIIVAVIDSGVDTLHEDLSSVLWKNRKEIPYNGIDDDKNGFIDDVYGWNFIGGKDGRNVSKDSYEGARVYFKYREVFGEKEINEDTLRNELKPFYKTYKKAQAQLESQAKDAALYVLILKDIVARIPSADSTIQQAIGKNEYTGDELQSFKSTDPLINKAKSVVLSIFQQTKEMDKTNTLLIGELTRFYEGEKSKLEAIEKAPRPYRAEIVQDIYSDINDRFYGNADVMGPESSHGTHVSGIIGADRKNGIGINGIADHVEIMTIRAVPDGDEHDKDIANAIRYAVDNGAWVINMSFGKSFSPEKNWVDEAALYAESKGVLLVHAAGNDAKNIDIEDNFPSKNLNNDTNKVFTNWINVGASGASEEEIIASFSNYGKREVNVFAPGVRIYSTIPGGNVYGEKDGTSMASPVVSGLAALILSYYPTLSVKQLKWVIEQSVTKVDKTNINKEENENEMASLQDLSSTGGIINAYNAIKLASTLKGERILEANKSNLNKKGNRK
ncbi:MAG: S8 family peptidase [bacterium]|jgi:cell wall-associated protease